PISRVSSVHSLCDGFLTTGDAAEVNNLMEVREDGNGLADLNKINLERLRQALGSPVSPDLVFCSLRKHDRITPKTIASLLQRKVGHQFRLFDEEECPLDKRIDFYKHEIDWANRLILGDSLLVMTSLLTKELMGGKVQMIHVDLCMRL